MPYGMTEQHIRLLQAKRDRLTRALVEAEAQYIVAVAREFDSGRIAWAELYRTYQVIRDGGLAGFSSRWLAVLPYTVQKMRLMANAQEIQEWAGCGTQIEPSGNWPPKGTCVVYVLSRDDGEPTYVGSTHNFSTRLGRHRHAGKAWASWRAYRCRDRQHAYEVEARFLRQFKPEQNKRGAGAAR
jgi:predicted GIY-YIG superfamily endonuclease